MKGYHEYKDGQKDFGRVDAEGLQRYVQMYKDEGVLKEMPPIKDLYTDQFVECINKVDAAAVRKLARNGRAEFGRCGKTVRCKSYPTANYATIVIRLSPG